jgi:hypothetical protein
MNENVNYRARYNVQTPIFLLVIICLRKYSFLHGRLVGNGRSYVVERLDVHIMGPERGNRGE